MKDSTASQDFFKVTDYTELFFVKNTKDAKVVAL